MPFDFAEDHRMIIDLVSKFVDDKLMPLEKAVMAREAAGDPVSLLPDEEDPLLAECKELGLWALDAPEEVGLFALGGGEASKDISENFPKISARAPRISFSQAFCLRVC